MAAEPENRDFAFGRWGGPFDGKCLAAVPLPDYPIAEMRTGQYLPEQGDLWSAKLFAPADPDELRSLYTALAGAEPIARADFDLYLRKDRLIYLRETCAAADMAADFFLVTYPEDLTDLPEHLRADGHYWLGFTLTRYGGRPGGECLAAVPLPAWPGGLSEIYTGQEGAWEGSLYPPADPEELRAEYTALAGIEPAARAAFDLYRQDNRLIYLRESCAAADTAAEFFMMVFPEGITDLPAELREVDSEWRPFNFARHGGPFDGKCLAAVPLPDYPIAEMRTGQYGPGQGN